MANRMNWDNIYYKGDVVGAIIVYTKYINTSEYRIAYSLDKSTNPKQAFESRLVGTVYNCKSHEEAFNRVYNKVSNLFLARNFYGMQGAGNE